MRSVVFIIPCLFLVFSGCDKDQKPLEEGCDARIPGTGKEQLIPHPSKPSSCAIAVLMCNACVYDADGQFKKVDTTPCGVCLSTSTK